MKTTEHVDLAQAIVNQEWALFDQVKNIGGRADCQDNWPAFYVMRMSQFLAWPAPVLTSYQRDLERGEEEGRNLLSEKYGYMMETTSPAEYAKIRDQLPEVSADKRRQIERICIRQERWMEQLHRKYPHLMSRARPVSEEYGGWQASFRTYLMGELCTYSSETLSLYGEHVEQLYRAGENMNEQIVSNQMRYFGYDSLEAVEASLSGKR